jgi:hypothetical protein
MVDMKMNNKINDDIEVFINYAEQLITLAEKKINRELGKEKKYCSTYYYNGCDCLEEMIENPEEIVNGKKYYYETTTHYFHGKEIVTIVELVEDEGGYTIVPSKCVKSKV